jgi:hypothetical protein
LFVPRPSPPHHCDETTQEHLNNLYLVSLPERMVRALAAGVGDLIYEATEVLLPGWLRRSRLYQAIVAALLRITMDRRAKAWKSLR